MLRRWVFVMLTVAAIAPPGLGAQEPQTWPPERYLRPAVRGVLTDSVTGRPIVRAAFRAPRYQGIGFTDSLGRYLLFDAPHGTVELSFHCPTRRWWFGARFVTVHLSVSGSTDSVVDVVADSRQCVDPPLLHERRELAGRYTSGFEGSEFLPCKPLPHFPGTNMPDSTSLRAWLDFEPGVIDGRRWPKVKRDRGYATYFIRVRGTLIGPGMYGHLGGSDYHFVASELLEIRKPGKRDCAS